MRTAGNRSAATAISLIYKKIQDYLFEINDVFDSGIDSAIISAKRGGIENMRRKIISNDDGLSLLEVLIGMIILAVGLMGLAPMLVVSIEGNTISRDNSVAANLLKQKIEYFEGLSSMPAVPYREVESGLQNTYTRTSSVNDHAADTLIPDGLYKIDITVSWTDNQSVQRSNQYSTYKVKSS